MDIHVSATSNTPWGWNFRKNTDTYGFINLVLSLATLPVFATFLALQVFNPDKVRKDDIEAMWKIIL